MFGPLLSRSHRASHVTASTSETSDRRIHHHFTKLPPVRRNEITIVSEDEVSHFLTLLPILCDLQAEAIARSSQLSLQQHEDTLHDDVENTRALFPSSDQGPHGLHILDLPHLIPLPSCSKEMFPPCVLSSTPSHKLHALLFSTPILSSLTPTVASIIISRSSFRLEQTK